MHMLPREPFIWNHPYRFEKKELSKIIFSMIASL
jgi:hypothetical protein